jgi:hypothetical protein
VYVNTANTNRAINSVLAAEVVGLRDEPVS